MTGRTVLVTGASGFVGSNIVASLRARGDRVIGLARSGHASTGETRVADDWTPAALSGALAGVDAIVHAASVVHRPGASDDEYRCFNVEGTRRLIDAAAGAGVGALVFLSTIKVYGETPPRADEDTPVAPEGGYAVSKVEAEEIVRSFGHAAILRLSPSSASRDKGNVRTMIRAIARRRFMLPGDGATRKSLVHVSTIVDVVSAVLTRAVVGTFVVADRVAPSMSELSRDFHQLVRCWKVEADSRPGAPHSRCPPRARSRSSPRCAVESRP